MNIYAIISENPRSKGSPKMISSNSTLSFIPRLQYLKGVKIEVFTFVFTVNSKQIDLAILDLIMV